MPRTNSRRILRRATLALALVASALALSGCIHLGGGHHHHRHHHRHGHCD